MNTQYKNIERSINYLLIKIALDKIAISKIGRLSAMLE